jgi:hypothetical protein
MAIGRANIRAWIEDEYDRVRVEADIQVSFEGDGPCGVQWQMRK